MWPPYLGFSSICSQVDNQEKPSQILIGYLIKNHLLQHIAHLSFIVFHEHVVCCLHFDESIFPGDQDLDLCGCYGAPFLAQLESSASSNSPAFN